MAKSPEDRYQSAEEMLADLDDLASGGSGSFRSIPKDRKKSTEVPKVTVTDSPPTDGSSSGGFFRGRRAMLAAGGFLILLAIGLILLTYFRGNQPPEKDAASTGVGPIGDAPVVPGVTPTEITLGTTTVYSGVNRDMGRKMVAGIRTCFEAVNEAGGIHGRKLKLVVLDDGYEPQRALANMQDLFENRDVFAVIGNVGTPTAAVTVPYAIENKHLFFAPLSGANILRQDPPDRYVFNYRASYSDETDAMVSYFIDVKGIPAEQIAVFAQNDAFGDDGFHGVARALRKHGVREDSVLRVGYERNSIDVKQAVDQIAQRGESVKAVVVVATSSAAAHFISQLRKLNLEPTFGVVSFASATIDAELKAIAPNYSKGVIVTQIVPHYKSGATGVIRYRKLLKKHFPQYQPDFVSLEGFIAAECLVEGLRRAGRNLNTETLIDSLESIRDLDLGVGPIMSFGPSKHQASDKVWGTVLDESGNFQNLDLE
jgi:ABC-type branched-subunit amino acid transport system substrate-binding protein